MASDFCLGQRVSYDGALCTVRYIGEVAGTTGQWLGVEWDDATRGKHNGNHKGVQYFTCIAKSPTAASFVRPTRPAESPQSFIPALRNKYASEYTQQDGRRLHAEIIFFGKVAEEVGFDKIQRKQARLDELKIAILDDMLIGSARGEGEEEGIITKTCPKVHQLDLSRNLFNHLGPVLDVCRELPLLQSLTINGNRFHNVLQDKSLESSEQALQGVKELALEQTLLSWEELCHIAIKCPSLAAFDAGSNQLSRLPIIDYHNLTATLTSINLEFNDFTSLADLSSLTALTSLRSLHLKGNNISTTAAPEDAAALVFPPSVAYLDVSYNNIQTWSFVDQLPKHLPGLSGLRLSHNPVYDVADPEGKAAASSSEESHMLTVARLGNLKTLNLSAVTAADRTNAEMFYLSRIGKQLATVPEAEEHTVLKLHPRYTELCALYGAPVVIRRQEVNPNFLEARLVTVEFHCEHRGSKTVRIPKSFDIYRVKGIAGRLFDLPPLQLRLIWETGEWDPVAGFDEQDRDSSDDEEEGGQTDVTRTREAADQGDADGKPGRWIKREVELRDGPRQLGYCVDGLDVKIRVEVS